MEGMSERIAAQHATGDPGVESASGVTQTPARRIQALLTLEPAEEVGQRHDRRVPSATSGDT